jgi:hypothetical protein
MKYKCLIAYLLAFLALPQVAIADILAILINPDSLSYDLSSGNYANSAGNYANGINGENRIISEDNLFLGYYVFSDSGVMNLYSASGNRVAYMPSGGHTQSLFFSQGGWCGTIGESGGKTVLGLTRNCHLRFTLD